MAHVELSLSGVFVPQARTPVGAEFVTNIDRWTSTVAAAEEPCLVIDFTTTILAISDSCGRLLGLGEAPDLVGQPLLGSALRLVDFTAGRGELADPDTKKIPPLLALTTQRLARGLMRVQPDAHEQDVTVDAIATPLWINDQVAASLTFFSQV